MTIIYSFITVSKFLIVLRFIYSTKGDIYSSKGIDMILHEQYMNAFNEFVRTFDATNPETHLLQREVDILWRHHESNYFNKMNNIKSYSLVLLKKHMLYAFAIAEKNNKLQEVVQAIHIKVHAFVHGVNYLNCAFCHDESESSSEYRKMKNDCKKIAFHLLIFTGLGIRELRQRTSKEGLDPDYVEVITKFIHLMDVIENDYWFVLINDDVLRNIPPTVDIWIGAYKYIRTSDVFYDVLLKHQFDEKKRTSLFNILFLLEMMKFSADNEFYKTPSLVSFTKSNILWASATRLVVYACERETNLTDKINFSKKKTSLNKTCTFDPYMLIYESEIKMASFVARTNDDEFLRSKFEEIRMKGFTELFVRLTDDKQLECVTSAGVMIGDKLRIPKSNFIEDVDSEAANALDETWSDVYIH